MEENIMKIKLGEALKANKIIREMLENTELNDTAFKFKLLLLANALQPMEQNFDMLRNQKIMELGTKTKDENGQENSYIPAEDAEAINKFNESMEQLLSTEITIPVDKLKAQDVFSKNLPVDYMIGLCGVIEV
jgi:hypothetical protein